jgi:hypothetical protein
MPEFQSQRSEAGTLVARIAMIPLRQGRYAVVPSTTGPPSMSSPYVAWTNTNFSSQITQVLRRDLFSWKHRALARVSSRQLPAESRSARPCLRSRPATRFCAGLAVSAIERSSRYARSLSAELAAAVARALGPPCTYTALLPPAALPPGARRRLAGCVRLPREAGCGPAAPGDLTGAGETRIVAWYSSATCRGIRPRGEASSPRSMAQERIRRDCSRSIRVRGRDRRCCRARAGSCPTLRAALM